MFKSFDGMLLFDKDDGGNGGNDEKILPADVVKAFESLLERKGGNANAVALMLFDENKELRSQKRTLEGKVPAEGSVILSSEDAKAWTSYQSLGKPEEVRQGLDERTQLQGKVSMQERESLLRNVADVAGYKPSVLMNLDRVAKVEGKELVYAVRDVTVEGKTVKQAYVKEGDKESSLADYATANWSDFMPALTVVQGTQQQQSQGTRHLTQHATTNSAETQTTKTLAQKTLDKAYASREDKK